MAVGRWPRGLKGMGACGARWGTEINNSSATEQDCLLNFACRSANVLLSVDWRAALTDLGVAQVMEHTARTAAGGSRLYAGGQCCAR